MVITLPGTSKRVSVNNPCFIQFLSYTVSPVLTTNNITLYLHIQVPLSLLLTLWLLWKDLKKFLVNHKSVSDRPGWHHVWWHPETVKSTQTLRSLYGHWCLDQAPLLCREQWCLRVDIPALGGLPLVRIPLAITRSKDLVQGSPYLT